MCNPLFPMSYVVKKGMIRLSEVVNIKLYLIIIFFTNPFIVLQAAAQMSRVVVSSPDGHIEVRISSAKGQAWQYSILHGGQTVIWPSSLGLVRDDEDFHSGLELTNASPVQKLSDRYSLFTGKKTLAHYKANKRVLQLKNSKGKKMEIIFQVSNDGVAFRYYFPENENSTKTILEEKTSFQFDTQAKAFLQPMSVAKSGWERTNPAYEEHYQKNISVGTPVPNEAGWVFPALFQTGNHWILISETGLDSNYCGSRLHAHSTGGNYRIAFPDEKEVIGDGNRLPRSRAPQYSPWRILAIGSLKTIVESTLGTDLAAPALNFDRSFIRPGISSWSWIMSKDDSIVYSEQKKYIDFAADMKWAYCLIDAAWDQKIGYEKIKELAQYAASKNVGLLLWYNSAGNWNTVKYTPKDKLLTQKDRIAEFSRIRAMGIKGVKIDFFGGDGQSVIRYYHEILLDAADQKLMVNFHGATIPRGWHRTYPHLLTTEAVRGFEMVTFNQQDADAEASHVAMLPFTRNAFDPMDFTPMNLYRIPTRVVRKTTPAFELATTILMLSGIQHLAESPDGMSRMPVFIKDYLRKLPVQWDEVKYLDGYPGRFVVIARRSGKQWYLAGINGEDAEKLITLNLNPFKKKKAWLIADGDAPPSMKQETITIPTNKKLSLTLKPRGGFVLVLE
jgi:alpha-glucosidase